jgi:cell wall-associated NlpC family hydrolase
MAAAAVVALGGLSLPAWADPTDGPSQQQVDAARAAADAKAHTVEGVQTQLDAANDRLDAAEMSASIAAEAANGAIYHLQLAQDAAAKADAAEAKAKAKLSRHKAAYTDLVARTYEQQPQLQAINAMTTQAEPRAMMSSASTTYQLTRAMDDIETGYRDAAAEAGAAADKADAARSRAASLAAQATAARNRAQATADNAAAEADRVGKQKQKLVSELATLQHISVQLAAQRQAALEEQRRQAAAAAAKARAEAEARAAAAAAAKAAAQAAASKAAADKAAQQDNSDAGNDDSADSGFPPPAPLPPVSSGGVESAISFAKAQLGDWYLWGAAGPDRWDCSGLTMMAFRQAGIYLPHFSGAQYDAGTPIPVSSAQRGDLLFWTSNGRPSGIHHVAIYLGNDQVLEAPHAGAQVRIRSLEYWYPDLAVRL